MRCESASLIWRKEWEAQDCSQSENKVTLSDRHNLAREVHAEVPDAVKGRGGDHGLIERLQLGEGVQCRGLECDGHVEHSGPSALQIQCRLRRKSSH